LEVKVCPKCYSQNIDIVYPDTDIGIWKDECKDCGYKGTSLLMEKEAANKLIE
jgi:ribosomal protein L37AE/L43A